MDLLLFERYGLNINENNTDVISKALEKSKAESNWEKNLNAKNDKILSKAKAEQARWNEDREILLNDSERANAAREISKTIEAIVAYIDQHIKNEDKFENAVSAFIEWDLKADDIRNIYEKYRSQFSTVPDPKKVNELKKLARELVKSYGGFINIKKGVDDNIFSKFYDEGIDLTDFASALKLDACRNHYDIIENAERISSVAYDIYNRKLIKDSLKNAFMDVFSKSSTGSNNLVAALNDPWIEELSFANWAVVKEINLTCKFMDSETIALDNIQELPADRQQNFIKAMKKLFGIKAEGSLESSASTGRSTSKGNVLPSEIKLGEAELKKSDFQKATSYFNAAINKNPYCWQGYWGLYKARLHATNNEEIYFPGFIDMLNRKSRGEQVDDAVDLYVHAKEIAIAQRDASINFFEIENNYKIADRKAAQYYEYRDNLAQAYNGINENVVPNKEFSKFVSEFREKARVYVKHSDIVSSGFSDFSLFFHLSVFFLFAGLTGFFSYLGARGFDEVSAIISMIAGTIAGGKIGSRLFHTLIGVGVGGTISVLVNGMLVDYVHVFLLNILLILASLACFAYMVHKISEKRRIKPGFEQEKEDIRKYLEENLAKCYLEDLNEYCNSNNMKTYGVVISAECIEKIDLTKYLEIMGEVQPTYYFSY